MSVTFNRFDLPLTLDLQDTRRIAPLRVTYDFDRGGWSILKERELLHVEDSGHCHLAQTGEWVEVAFVDEDVVLEETTLEAVNLVRDKGVPVTR